jgi:proteasome accessory factor B
VQKVIERLLNLLAFLLTTDHPVTAEEIRYTVAGYGDKSDEAFRRTFERDKELLREIGVPLELEATDRYDVEYGYVIPQESYALVDPGLTEEERTALALAAEAVRFGGQPSGPDAVLKLGGALAGEGAFPVGADLGGEADTVAVAFAAVSERRPLTFTYNGRTRTVDAYGLVHRRGHWYLVGPERGEPVKVYRLDRASGMTAGEPGSFDRPKGFRARDAVATQPWDQGAEGIPAVIHFDPDVAWIAERELGGLGTATTNDDGSIDVTITVGASGPLLSWLVGFEDRAEILWPPELVDRYLDLVRS